MNYKIFRPNEIIVNNLILKKKYVMVVNYTIFQLNI